MISIKPKVVFLDWNGTISDSKFWGHLDNASHPLNDFYQRTQASLFGDNKHLLLPWMKGEFSSEQVLSQVSEITGLNYDILYSEFVTSCQGMSFGISNLESLVKKIQNTGTKVVIATDNMDSFSRWTIPALQLHTLFDDILDSFLLKAMKRDFDDRGNSLFFGDFLCKNHIAPNECILIDDSEDRENRLANFGIDYRRIDSSNELEFELLRLI